MFVLKASVWLNALKEFRPDIANATQAAWHNKTYDAKFVRPGKVGFAATPSESIDYAVMERCPGCRLERFRCLGRCLGSVTQRRAARWATSAKTPTN